MNKHDQYWKLSEMEERFNSSSAGIRTLASAWLLGAFGSIGWMFSVYDPDKWFLPLGFLIVIVLTFASIGFTTLWVMDQLVFHRLLNSVFLVGLKMEKDNPELPPIRSMMMKTLEGSGTFKWELFFYLGPIMLFMVITIFTLLHAYGANAALSGVLFNSGQIVLSIMLLGLQFVCISLVLMKFKLVSSFELRSSWFDDKEFENIVTNRRYETIINKYTGA